MTDELDEAAWNRLLRRIIELMAADHALPQSLGEVGSVLTEITGADACFIHVLDEEHGVLTLAGATAPFDDLAGSVTLQLGEGVSGWVAAHAEPAIIQDKWSDPRYRYIPALRGEDFTTMISIPMLRRGGGVVGVVNLHSTRSRTLTAGQIELFCDVANLLAGLVDNARLYTALAEREAKLESFAATVIDTQEQERRRLAHDIHDGISQRLVGLFFHLSAATDTLTSDPAFAAAALATAQELARAALDETRAAITGLRPALLDDLGLAASIESLARTMPGLEVSVDADDEPLPAHMETALFRIVQEGLQNVAKHAGATSAWVHLTISQRWVTVEVTDDGHGLEVDHTGGEGRLGLTGMRERAELLGGTFALASSPGSGTSVTVRVPRFYSAGTRA